MKLTKQQAIERVFNNCNLKGVDVDIYHEIYKYKVLRKLKDAEVEEIYNNIALRLGFINQ